MHHPEPLFIGFLIAALVAGVLIYIYASVAASKRRKELQAWAATHGLSWDPGHQFNLDGRHPDFDCLRQGDNRHAYNVMTGAWNGRPCTAFDYHYETHSTDAKGRRQTHHHHFSAVIIESAVPLNVVHARTMESLLAQPRVTLKFDERSVIAYQGSTFHAAEFEAAADTAAGLLDRLPEHFARGQDRP